MTIEEFLAWEERQPVRYEFDGMRSVARAESSLCHSAILGNIVAIVSTRLKARPCRVFDSRVKLVVGGSVRYADASVTCSEQPDAVMSRQGVVRAPVLVFEILAQNTAFVDRIDKNAEYRATPSIMRYVMLEEDRIAATVFSRQAADWVGHLLLGAAAVLSLPKVGVDTIRLAEFYDGVSLPESTDGHAAR